MELKCESGRSHSKLWGTGVTKTPTALLVVMVVLCALSCSTFYYKQFVIGGTPRGPRSEISSNDMWWSFCVDVQPRNGSMYRDSTYAIQLAVYREAESECSDNWAKRFASIRVNKLVLAFADAEVDVAQRMNEPIEVISPCYMIWRYAPLTIPDSIDTVTIALSSTYMENGAPMVFDTTVCLIRQTGKEREFANF